MRQSHADFLRLLAATSGTDLSVVCRALLDRATSVPDESPPLLDGIDLSSHRKALKRLQRQASDSMSWASLDILLRDDQVAFLTGRAREYRSSLSRVLRHIVAGYLDEVCGGPKESFSFIAALDSVASKVNAGLFFKTTAALICVGLLAGGGWWGYENREKILVGTKPQPDVVIDSLEALEELERRNREAASK